MLSRDVEATYIAIRPRIPAVLISRYDLESISKIPKVVCDHVQLFGISLQKFQKICSRVAPQWDEASLGILDSKQGFGILCNSAASVWCAQKNNDLHTIKDLPVVLSFEARSNNCLKISV